MLEGFDYDAYMKRLDTAGFTNIKTAWSAAGKDLMEKTAAHVRRKTVRRAAAARALSWRLYQGMALSDYVGITEHLTKYTYGGVVRNDYGVKAQTRMLIL